MLVLIDSYLKLDEYSGNLNTGLVSFWTINWSPLGEWFNIQTKTRILVKDNIRLPERYKSGSTNMVPVTLW